MAREVTRPIMQVDLERLSSRTNWIGTCFDDVELDRDIEVAGEEAAAPVVEGAARHEPH